MERFRLALFMASMAGSAGLTGCPAVVGTLESASYPRDLHDDDWKPPAPTCTKGENNYCFADLYVGECPKLEPTVVWQTQHFSSQQLEPIPVEHLTASCIEASCEAEVRGGVVTIHGKTRGVSHVKVAYEHPVTHAHLEHVVEVPFQDAPTPDTLRPQMERPASLRCDAH